MCSLGSSVSQPGLVCEETLDVPWIMRILTSCLPLRLVLAGFEPFASVVAMVQRKAGAVWNERIRVRVFDTAGDRINRLKDCIRFVDAYAFTGVRKLINCDLRTQP